MPITPDRMQRLRDFGLSEYAARAYLALLDLGVAEARDVSTLSKVPQAKIYHVLEQLHDKGLAVILPEFPKKYAPVPFPEYLDRIHDEHKRQADSIMRDREVLAEMFRVMGDTDVGDRGFFTVVRGRRNVMSKIVEMIHDAQRDVLIMGTPGSALRQQHLTPEVQQAAERGVRIRALLPITPETIATAQALASPAFEIRARDLDGQLPQSSRVAIVVADGARAFLINFLPDDDNVYAGKDVAVYTDQEAMVAALATLVEPRWVKAATLEARRDELSTGRLPDATLAHSTIEQARAALDEALARGVREVRILDPAPATMPSDEGLRLVERIREAGASFRAIVNVGDVETARALVAALERSPGSEARHLIRRGTTRFAVFDDREAILGLTPQDGTTGTLSVHTTNPSAVASLRSQFEEAWTRAMPLGRRLDELEVFPHIQPRDLGIGRLFQDVRDPIFVADASGRIVLWNNAAIGAFGYDVAEALELRVGDIFTEPDAMRAVREAANGATIEELPTTATHRDASPLAVDLRVVPAREAANGATFALVIARMGAPGTRVSVLNAEGAPTSKASKKQ